MHIFADQISRVSLSNGNLRVYLSQRAGDDETSEAGTLIIPVNQANRFINALGNSLKQMNEQIKAQSQETEGEAQ